MSSIDSARKTLGCVGPRIFPRRKSSRRLRKLSQRHGNKAVRAWHVGGTAKRRYLGSDGLGSDGVFAVDPVPRYCTHRSPSTPEVSIISFPGTVSRLSVKAIVHDLVYTFGSV